MAVAAVVALVTTVAPLGGTASATQPAATKHRAAPFTVVTSVWAVAQMVSGIGQGQVRVLDVVPDGANPRGFVPDPAEVQAIEQANLVVDVGDGYQPMVERHVRRGHVVSLVPSLAPPSDPDVWMIPSQMERATSVIGKALDRVDPSLSKTFNGGTRAYTAMLLSLDTDYQSSLSDCQESTILTPDGALAGLARRYGLADRVVGASAAPDAAALRQAVRVMQNAQAGTAFTEPFVPTATVDRAASRAHLKVKEIQTLQGEPPGGWPARSLDTYYRLMEYDLGILVSALNCDLGDAGE